MRGPYLEGAASPMSKEVVLLGKVRKVEPNDWADKEGVVHLQCKVTLVTVVRGELADKVEMKTAFTAPRELVDKAKALQVGESVQIQAEIKSGANKDVDPAFIFLDDLTQRAKS